MSHDPLCPRQRDPARWPDLCLCDLIALTRADEGERIAKAIEANATQDCDNTRCEYCESCSAAIEARYAAKVARTRA